MVAIQGERGAYSEEAAVRLLGSGVQILCCEHFEDVFRHTAEGRSAFSVVPIENSLAGSIYKNYDLLLRYKLKIVRETNLLIEHHLIGLSGARFETIDTVISHPVALDQCEHFFQRHPRLKKQISYDTSGSVKTIVEKGLANWAGIAGKRAAEVYGGAILMSGIEDSQENFTRFFLLSRQLEITGRGNKTSIVFSFTNSPGALFKCLSVFALREIDLTKIESRPIRGRPWEYLFYLDFLGNVEEKRIQNALNHLSEITEFLEILGCYPRDDSQASKSM